MITCPICNSSSTHIIRLHRDRIINDLNRYYNTSVDMDLGIIDYDIFRCNECTLEFPSPMVGGSSVFYDWITSHSFYYTEDRWEYSEVIKLILGFSQGTQRLLDVGCGNGLFLRKLTKYRNIDAIGIDTTQESVTQCLAQELKAHNCDIEGLRALDPLPYDYIVSFHCLEHIDSPLEFMKSLKSTLSLKGKIFISVPLSPMSFESNWHDPLNYPPHHVTRWDFQSIKTLADILDMDINLYISPSSNILSRTVYAMYLQKIGSPIGSGYLNKLKQIAFNPLSTIFEFVRQHERIKFNSLVAGDQMLAEFTNKVS